MSRINILGASCIDLLISDVDREQFFSGKYKVERIRTYFGGDALNEAVGLAAFREDVRLSTIVGNDPSGQLIAGFLKEKGIRYDEDMMKDGIDTYVSVVLIEKDGQRNFVGSKNGSLRLYDLDDIRIDEDCEIASFASLFISKILDDEKLTKLFSSIKEKGILLCADTSTPKNGEKALALKCLSYLDYFFCNESEAMALCDERDVFRCEEIFYQAGIRNVVIKLGEKGCLFHGKIFAPQRKIRCVDTTGAGDSFAAGFIHGLSQGLPEEECIRLGNECGSMACEYIGASEWTLHL